MVVKLTIVNSNIFPKFTRAVLVLSKSITKIQWIISGEMPGRNGENRPDQILLIFGALSGEINSK